jgi:phage terminase large subunit-like protein
VSAAQLARLAFASRALASRARRSPVDHVAWLPYQVEFLSHDEPRPVLLRLGNRMGKSYAGGAELIFRARGSHPYKSVPRGPVRLALVCFSMVQSVEIQRVLWELLGGVENVDLTPGTEFSSRTGFRGHRPVVQFKNGSEIHVYSNAQGAGALAGSEYSWILMDEPPAEDVYDECRARVRNTGGGIGITLTPINGPPLPWLRKLTEMGAVRDIHQPLTPESQVSPVTGVARRTKAGRAWDADFISELREAENPIDAPIRLDGEWESRAEGQFFRCFDPLDHVTEHLPAAVLRLVLGLDYAAADRELGMCAVLSGIEIYEEPGRDGQPPRKRHRLYAIAEVVVPGATTMEVFAGQILIALQDLGLGWGDLDAVYGDNPVKSRFTQASNRELGRWISRGQGVSQNALHPRILSAKEGGGRSGIQRRSKDVRCAWTYGEVAAGRVRVHPRCRVLAKALQEWDYGDRHPMKDILDAWMYGLKDLWADARRHGDVPAVTFR